MNPCWPGCAHDSRVFRESGFCRKFDDRTYKGILLGDSAYALKPYLMTPFLYPECRAEEKFNESHIRTRTTIENTFGLWKKRFQCVAQVSEYQPSVLGKVIIATMCLHNIAMKRGDIWVEGGELRNLTVDGNERDQGNVCEYDNYVDLRQFPKGKDVRALIVAGTFSN